MCKAKNVQRKSRRHVLAGPTRGHAEVRQAVARELAEHRNTSGQWPSRGARALLLVVVAATSTACMASLPEWNLKDYVSSAPGKTWKPRPDQAPPPIPDETLAGIPPALEPVADKLALAQLVDVGLNNSPTTREAWARARAAVASWAQARGKYYPTLSASALGLAAGSFGAGVNGVDAFGNEAIGSVSGTLKYLLFDFGGRSAEAEAARQAFFSSDSNHNQAIQDVVRDVADAYYTHLGDLARLRAAEVTLKDALTNLEAAELRRRVGVATIVDVLQAQANVAQVRVTLEGARGAVETSRGKLATTVGWPANTQFGVVEEFEELPLDTVDQDIDALITKARRARPDLAAVWASVRQKEAELKQAKSALWPQVVLGATGGGKTIDGNDTNTNYVAGVEIQIPIFTGGILSNAVQEAHANLEAARAALRMQEDSVINTVWDAYYGVRTAAEQLKSSEVLLASATKSYEASLARYREGVADIVELLNAQNTLSDARTTLIQSRTSLYTSYADLVHAVGAEFPVPHSGGGIGSSDGGRETHHAKK